jgi:hypothetical protein
LTPRRLALGLGTIGIALLLGAIPAHAQQRLGRLRLVGQTTWLAEDQPFSLAFSSTVELPTDGTVELTLYGAVTSRATLNRGDRDPTLLGDVRDTVSVAAAIVPRGDDGNYRLRVQTDGTSPSLSVDDPGVYPLQIAIAGADGVAGRPMLTFLVRVDDDARETPLLTALVLPLHAAPAFGPEGDPVLSDRARRIFQVRSALLEHHRDVPLSVVPTPETLDTLAAADTDLLADVREALEDRHVIAGPYVRIDLAAFAAARDLATPLIDQFAAGRRTLRRILRQPLDQRTWAGTGNPTSPALDALDTVGVDRGLFRQESIAGGAAPITEPVLITGDEGQRFAAVLADPNLRTDANGTADPILMAHRALADLALLASPPEEGGLATDSGDAGVAIELPANRPLPAPYLDTLLKGLHRRGPLRPVTLAGLLQNDPTGEGGAEPGPEVEGIPVTSQDLTNYSRNLAITQASLTGYTSFAGRRDPTAAELRRRLLVSGSIDLTENQRSGYLRSVNDVIANRTSLVDISDDETITLTSREGDIPITIQNDTGGPVEVRLGFDSDNRLAFPDGIRRRVQLEEGVNRIEVPVVARTSGAFPLRITATSPDGILVVSRARITVRSTVVSGVGVVLSVGALLVLAAWWISHWRSTRRNRRLVDPGDLPVNTDPNQSIDRPAPSASTGEDADPPPV